MEDSNKKILFWFGLLLVLPIASFASGVSSVEIVDNGISFDTYTMPADYDKIAQEADNVSKYISNISGDGFENPVYIPRVYAASNAGTDLVWQADALVPLTLTTDQTSVFYMQGRYSPGDKKSWEYSTWTGSAGFLYRQIGSIMGMDDSVLGAYVLGDYNRAASGHRYWVIGPGVESLGRMWDFRLNAYIPTGSRFLENKAWAREFGVYNYIEFTEGTNNIYDHRLAYYEDKGVGGDFEVGRKLFKLNGVLVKGHVQGYYYNMQHATNIIGGGLKITAQPAKYITFSLNNSYDKYQRNTFMLGAQIRLNNLFNRSNKAPDENDLANRLLDPINRNYGNIGIGTSSPVIKTSLRDLGSSLYSFNGIFFSHNNSGYISPNAAQYRKGTYGNPYTEEGDITLQGMQAILDEIRGNFSGHVFMFFAPGNYQASDGGVAINLRDNMSIFGRDYWYKTPTTGDQRPLFLGSINLFGNNILNSMRIKDASPFASGLAASNVSNIVLNNIEVGTLSSTGNYATGIIMDNSSMAIANSKIYGYQSGAATADDQINAVGIDMINGGTLLIYGSEINGIANETGGVFNNTGNGYGIRVDGKQETLIVSSASIIGQGQGGAFYSGNGYGILVGSNVVPALTASAYISDNVITISDSILYGEGRNTGVEYSGNGFGLVIGFDEYGGGMGPGMYINNNIITVNNSYLTGLGYSTYVKRGNGYGMLLGINYGTIDAASGTASAIITGNTVNIISSSLCGNSYGMLLGSDVFISYATGFDGLINSVIYDNDIFISEGSTLVGDRNYSLGPNVGSAHGLHIGYGEYNAQTGIGSNNVINSLIYGNNISILASSLLGNGYETAGSSYSGNGYGLTIGYRNIIAQTGSTGSGIYIKTYENNILVHGSTLAANGNGSGPYMSGNAYGVLVDSDYITKVGSGITNTVDDNHIALNLSTINSTSAGASGYAWGINIANNADAASLNILNINQSTINLDASTRRAYGVWMLLGSGTLNVDASTTGAITRNDPSILGCKVYNPIGGCTAGW